MTRRETRWTGHPCPEGGPAHGPLLAMRDGSSWLCIHSAHNGRPKSHPDGPAPATSRFFTTDQVQPTAN